LEVETGEREGGREGQEVGRGNAEVGIKGKGQSAWGIGPFGDAEGGN